MPMTLTHILSLPSLKEATLLAGQEGLTNEVSNIMIMEAPDVEKWASAGQLLLSSLFSIQHFSIDEQESFIEKLVTLNVSGLIIKTRRFVDEIPPGILSGAARFHFPIIQIPGSAGYETIMIEVMQTLFNHKAKLLDHYRKVHQHLMTLALNQKDASLKETLMALEAFINNPVSFYKNRKQVIFQTDHQFNDYRVINELPLKQENLNFECYRQTVRFDAYPNDDYSQLLIPVKISAVGTSYLIIHEINETVGEMDFMAIENSIIALQLELLKLNSINEVKQNYFNDIFDDVLYGKYHSKEQLSEYAQLLRLDEQLSYRVVVWQFSNQSFSEKPSFEVRKKQKEIGGKLMRKLLQYYPHLTYRIRSNRIILIISANRSEFEQKQFSDNLLRIHQNWQDEPILCRVGISDATFLDDINTEAKKALQVVQQATLFFADVFVLTYEDLGIYRMFGDLIPFQDYQKYIPKKLQLIIDAYPDWVDTLSYFLDFNQSLKKTAEQLFIHYKTVSYRIEKIHELVNLDFDNPEEILQLQIGLRLHRLISNKEIFG